MYSEQRKAEICSLLGSKGSIDVNVLAEHFRISRETVRRDLTDLEKAGVLKRTHGGAILETVPLPSPQIELPIDKRNIRQIEEKKHICQEVARSIAPGDTIFVDNSSTLSYLPLYISENLHITIISNSISFLCEASKVNCQNWLLVSLGGILNPKNLSLYGSDTQKNAALYYPNKTFISCTGISSVNKITDLSPLEVEIKRMMIDRSQQVFLLADHTKFGQTGQVFICDFSAIDHIITDGPWEQQENGLDFSAMGIDITVVEPEKQE